MIERKQKRNIDILRKHKLSDKVEISRDQPAIIWDDAPLWNSHIIRKLRVNYLSYNPGQFLSGLSLAEPDERFYYFNQEWGQLWKGQVTGVTIVIRVLRELEATEVFKMFCPIMRGLSL